MIAHRAVAEIDLGAIKHNYKYIKSLVGSAGIIAVVKANAYGHGSVRVATELEKEGCRFFAVACLDEAIQLRSAGIKSEILILGTTPEEDAPTLEKNGITQTVTDLDYAVALARNAHVKVHIKIDTGMSRLGIYCHGESDIVKAKSEVESVFAVKGLEVAGIFTHFAESDDLSSDVTLKQYKLFDVLCKALAEDGYDTGLKHCCNSAAILRYPEMHMDMVRPGIILYGHSPSAEVCDANLVPAMKLLCRVYSVKRLHKGDKVSYGGGYTAVRDTDVAVISIGYADGFSRILSGKANVVINGYVCPVIGRICMDLCMVDVTGKPGIKRGDSAVIFDSADSVNTLAEAMGTINYEVLCMFRQRVTQVYSGD